MSDIYPLHFCRHTHAATFMQHSCCSMHTTLSIHAALMQPHSRSSTYVLSPLLCCRIDAAALTLPHLCRSIHAAACRVHAAGFTQHLLTSAFTLPHLCCRAHTATFFRRSYAAALMLPLSRCRIYAAPRTQLHFFVAAFTLQLLGSSIHEAAFTLPLEHYRIYAAAHALALCR